MLLNYDVFTFLPGDATTGQFACNVGALNAIAMVGTRLPSNELIRHSLTYGGNKFQDCGSDLRYEFGRWWQIDFLSLNSPDEVLVPVPSILPTNFTLTAAGAHEGIALLLCSFSTLNARGHFSINGKPMIGWGSGVDWIDCSVIDPPFQVVVSGGK